MLSEVMMLSWARRPTSRVAGCRSS